MWTNYVKNCIPDLKIDFRVFDVVGIDGNDLKMALTVPIEDFEDALQAWCAGKINADGLITRDRRGFANAAIPIIAPSEINDSYVHGIFGCY
jgi:hypothetical protein